MGYPVSPHPWGLTQFTPTVPKFYWDVETQEQRIKLICKLIQDLIDGLQANDAQTEKNRLAIEELKTLFEEFKEHGFDDYYREQVEKWIVDNIGLLYERFAKQVFFGLTDDGYFCAYVPASWAEITFDTGAIYGTEEYGRLILRYSADGHGVIDNTGYDSSVMSDTIDARLKEAAGEGLKYANSQLNVSTGNGIAINPNTKMVEVPIGSNLRYTSDGIDAPDADQATSGVAKLTHEVNNSTDAEWAVTSDGVYAYAPSKSETIDQPEGNACTEIMDGVGIVLTEISRSGHLVQFKIEVSVESGYTLNAYTNICRLPAWAGSGSGASVAPSPFVFVSNGGYLQSTKSISAGSSAIAYMTVNYKG